MVDGGLEVADGGIEVADGGIEVADGGAEEVIQPVCEPKTVGPAGDEPFAPTTLNSSHVLLTGGGGLTLDVDDFVVASHWQADGSTVVKWNVATGSIEAAYLVCSGTVAGTLDAQGDYWIFCADGELVKIVGDPVTCPDTDGDGGIDTSSDLNQDGSISGGEILPTGDDECVVLWKQTGITCLAGAAADDGGNLWVADCGTDQLHRFAVDDGQLLESIPLPHQPFRLLVALSGEVWLAGRTDCMLMRYQPLGDLLTTWPVESCAAGLYDLAEDSQGRIWLSDDQFRIHRFDPSTEVMTSQLLDPTPGQPRGLVAGPDGYLYLSFHTPVCAAGRHLARIDPQNMTETALFELDDQVLGLDELHLDSNGLLRTLAVCKDQWWLVDPATGGVALTVSADGVLPGTGQFGYGGQGNGLQPAGWYRHRFQYDGAPQVQWTSLALQADSGDGYLDLRLRAAATEPELAAAEWSAVQGPYPPNTWPLDLSPNEVWQKTWLEVEVRLHSPSLQAAPPVVESLTVGCQ